MNDYQFTYKGTLYECTGETKDFDIKQFRFIIETHDWITMKNRIINQLRWFPEDLKVVVKHKARVLTKKEVEEGRSNAYDYIDFDKINDTDVEYLKNNLLKGLKFPEEDKNKFW